MKPKYLVLLVTGLGGFFSTVNIAPAQPVITTQPQDQTNYVGTTATFTVVLSGSEPVSEVWTLILATPASLVSYAWLQYYGLPTDCSPDHADTDGDGMNNWQEWIDGTDPTNPPSVLRMLASAGVANAPGVTLTWQNVSGISYFVERSTDLGNQPAFSLLETNIPGQPGTTTYTAIDATGPGPFFYRVGVGN